MPLMPSRRHRMASADGPWTPSSLRTLTATAIVILVIGVQAAGAADVPCRFSADSETVDMTVMIAGKEHWHETMKKGESKTVQIPEGPFTVVSKVDNPNLKTKGDIHTDTHTLMCGQNTTISVPLFALSR